MTRPLTLRDAVIETASKDLLTSAAIADKLGVDFTPAFEAAIGVLLPRVGFSFGPRKMSMYDPKLYVWHAPEDG